MKRAEWDALSPFKKHIINGQPYAAGEPDAEGNRFRKVDVPGINCHAGNCVDEEGKIECSCGLDDLEQMKIEADEAKAEAF